MLRNILLSMWILGKSSYLTLNIQEDDAHCQEPAVYGASRHSDPFPATAADRSGQDVSRRSHKDIKSPVCPGS